MTLLWKRTGQIKYGDTIIDISSAPCKDPLLNRKIEEAYLKRYATPENLPYATGISQPEYANFAMELLYPGT